MKEQLTEFTLAKVQPLVEESEHAFLPPKNSPNETVSDMLALFTADPEFRIFGFEKSHEPVSYIIALGDRKHQKSLAIGPMYVSKKYRSKGLGKKQVQRFVGYAREKGCDTIFTKTWGNNAASRTLFESVGFNVEAVKTAERSDGDDTINYLLHVSEENKI